jgi:hypothetical protein
MTYALLLMAVILFLAWAWHDEDKQEREAESFLRDQRERTKRFFTEHDA